MKSLTYDEIIEAIKTKEVKTEITLEDIKEAGYSTNPVTIRTRQHYASLSAAEKKRRWRAAERRKHERSLAGFCYKCGKLRERSDIANCNKCHQKNLDRVRKYRVDNALDGKCAKCSNVVNGNSSHCEACKAKARLYQRNKRHVRRPSEEC